MLTGMSGELATVLADLRGEGDELDGLVAGLSDAGWALPTPAEGWTIAHQVSHLAWTDRLASLAASDSAAAKGSAAADSAAVEGRAAVKGGAAVKDSADFRSGASSRNSVSFRDSDGHVDSAGFEGMLRRASADPLGFVEQGA